MPTSCLVLQGPSATGELGQDTTPFSPPSGPDWSLPVGSLQPSFPALHRALLTLQKSIREERAGWCSEMGAGRHLAGPDLSPAHVLGLPSPGSDHAEPAQMQKADTPV